MHRPVLLALLLAAPLCHADPLTQADKQALLEKLDALRDTAKEKAMSRMGGAVTAFRAAMASDDAAMDLYLKCVEKVDFEDQKKSTQDFREWKRRQGDRLDSPGFKVTLRHQLRWLVLTLEAAEKPDKISDLAPRASDALASIYDNPDQFGGDAEPLRQPVTSTVFARAYSLGGLKLEKWPTSPLENAAVFEQVIIPPLRAKQSFDAMREQWNRRIRYEGISRQSFGGGGGGRRGGERGGDKGKHEEASPDYEKFISETQPELQWQMEMDLYKAGDQKRSALRMLEHIESHVTHPKAREWGQQFRALIEPPKAAEGAETAEKTE